MTDAIALLEMAVQVHASMWAGGKQPTLEEAAGEVMDALDLVQGRAASAGGEVAEQTLFEASDEARREEAALRQIARTWAAETFVVQENHWEPVSEAVLDFMGMLDRRCVRPMPGLPVGQIVTQEMCGQFPGVDLVQLDGHVESFRGLARREA